MAVSNEVLLEKIHLVVDRLMHLGGADYDADKSAKKEDTASGKIARDFGIEEWDWPQGVGLYGLLKLQNYYGDTRYNEFLDQWYQRNIEVGLPSKNINTTAPYLTLADLLDVWKRPEYESMCLERAEWLMNELPRTKEGGFQHVTTAIGDRSGVLLNDGEMWIDTIFMAVLFLNKMGQRFERREWSSEALRQVLMHIKYLFDKKTGLFYHGWTFHGNHNFGGIFWCRGNCWFTFAVMDFLEACGDNIDPGVKQYLIDTYKAQVDALVKLQAPSGLWHTVLTDETSYEEVSGTAGFAVGIIKGIKLGILDDSYRPCAQKALEGICASIADDGTVLKVSAGTGMGNDADHYRNIMIAPMAYGQSLALVALCEGLGL